MKLHHINIAAAPSMLEATKIFYCDILGLRDGPRPNLNTPGYWLYSQSDPIVHLSESVKRRSSAQNNYLDHIAFADNNLKERLQILDKSGLDYTLKKFMTKEMTQIFLYDPCGTRIELNFSELPSDI